MSTTFTAGLRNGGRWLLAAAVVFVAGYALVVLVEPGDLVTEIGVAVSRSRGAARRGPPHVPLPAADAARSRARHRRGRGGGSAEEALALAENTAPDVAEADLNLPGVDGVD